MIGRVCVNIKEKEDINFDFLESLYHFNFGFSKVELMIYVIHDC
jgi:hypothetical protein